MTGSISSVIAIDAGGTEIKAAHILGSTVLDEKMWATKRELGPDHSVQRILEAAVEMHNLFPEARAIGLVVPGVVDTERGIARYSENLLWRDVPFSKKIGELTGLPVSFGHDVRAGGLSEAMYGAARGYKNSFFMPIGTGIAGAIIVNGELFDDPFSGEIGHLNVDSGIDCACGVTGCLESIATAPSIAKRYSHLSGNQVSNSREVLDRAKRGDVCAKEVWLDAMNAIGRAAAAYVTIMAPEIFVFGGGVSNAGEDLLEPIRQYLDKWLTFQKRPALAIAKLGDRAGMIGAGILASNALELIDSKQI